MNLSLGLALLAELMGDLPKLQPRARTQAVINLTGALRNAQRAKIARALKVERELAKPAARRR